MANVSKSAKKLMQSVKEQKTVPKAQERALGRLAVQMKCKRKEKENEWNFKTKSPFDAILQGEKICKENGFRFPQDVVTWEFS